MVKKGISNRGVGREGAGNGHKKPALGGLN